MFGERPARGGIKQKGYMPKSRPEEGCRSSETGTSGEGIKRITSDLNVLSARVTRNCIKFTGKAGNKGLSLPCLSKVNCSDFTYTRPLLKPVIRLISFGYFLSTSLSLFFRPLNLSLKSPASLTSIAKCVYLSSSRRKTMPL